MRRAQRTCVDRQLHRWIAFCANRRDVLAFLCDHRVIGSRQRLLDERRKVVWVRGDELFGRFFVRESRGLRLAPIELRSGSRVRGSALSLHR